MWDEINLSLGTIYPNITCVVPKAWLLESNSRESQEGLVSCQEIFIGLYTCGNYYIISLANNLAENFASV